MRALTEILRWLQTASWVILAIAAVNVWRKRRDNSSRWLALTFISLASVMIIGVFIPQDGPRPSAILIKLLIGVLVLFPWLLDRFVLSFVEARPWERRTAGALTVLVLALTAVLPTLPQPGEPRPPWLLAWTGVFLVQWGYLLVHVAHRLLRSARGQPAVAGKRMRTMGIGAAGLAFVLVVSSFAPSTTEPTVFKLVTQTLSLLAGPFFLLGFAPPGIVRMLWRRQEEVAMRVMEIGLVRAISQSEIADALLPRVVGLLGGRSALLLGPDGTVVGEHLTSASDIGSFQGSLPLQAEKYDPVTRGEALVLRMENGWLIVTIGPFTPFFGTDELRMLSAAAVIADLALGRAKLFELERQSREAMTDFVAIASHDLRTPVTVIHGFTQLMSNAWNDFGEDKKQEFIAAINRQVLHLDRLISDLLTVSKLDVDEVGVFPEDVDAASIARLTVEDVVASNDIALHVNGHSHVFADPEHVSRMMQNYVKNATVYGSGPISVDISGTNGWVTVKVRDNGSGVPETFVPRLFEKFARADKKNSRTNHGTGLGLSIVRGLARANGGDAWYERNDPTGACFALRLPSHRPAEASNHG